MRGEILRYLNDGYRWILLGGGKPAPPSGPAAQETFYEFDTMNSMKAVLPLNNWTHTACRGLLRRERIAERAFHLDLAADP